MEAVQQHEIETPKPSANGEFDVAHDGHELKATTKRASTVCHAWVHSLSGTNTIAEPLKVAHLRRHPQVQAVLLSSYETRLIRAP